MKNILFAFIILFGIQSEVNQTYQPVVVLELFTSQGCSGCPPADGFLHELAKSNDTQIIPLSYHVDYWDYNGWSDPFSSKVFTKKQHAYNDKFYNNMIFTPQIVVNGREQFIGSKKDVLDFKIKEYKNKRAANSIKLFNLDKQKSNLNFNYTLHGDLTNKVFKVVLVVEERITEVPRGENQNRTLTNANNVVLEQYVSVEEKNGEIKLDIPKSVIKTDNLRLVGIIETKDFDITGATQVKL